MTKTRHHLWIGGRWQEAMQYESLYAPYNGEKIADVAQAQPEEAKQAIEAAHDAFQSFKRTPAHERAEILYKAASILKENLEECAQTIAAEAAKPIQAAREEMSRTVQTYQFAAEAAKSIHGEQVPMDAAQGGVNRLGFTMRVPLGVITAITPFNFPFNLVAHKVGPAIAAGNAIVLKPAEQTPLSALYIAEVFKQAGLPDGVLNIIPGRGEELSEVLTSHPFVKKITFTGSPEVGQLIKKQSGFRKVTLELGSNSPLIVDEGVSVDSIIERCVQGAFSYNGQVCISVQRIYAHESLYSSFVEQFAAHTKQLKSGSPLAEDTNITAVISEKALQRLQQWLDEAVLLGGVIECGGTVDGRVMMPTVLTNVPHEAKVTAQEIFGPIVVIYPFKTLEEAVRLVNDSRYGLNAGIFTNRVDHAFYAAQEIECGGVIINDIPTFRIDNMPYGGWKDSGVGREGVRYAVEEMMETKFVSFKL